MAPKIKHPKDDSYSTFQITKDDSKKGSKKGSRVKHSTSDDLGSSKTPSQLPKPSPASVTPSKPPPRSSLSPPLPVSRDKTPSPPPPPSRSPPPPSPSQSPPPRRLPSRPPPPSLSPPPSRQPPPPLHNGDSSAPPSNFTIKKRPSASPPPPPFRAPPPPERPSSSPRSRGGASNDSTPRTHGKPMSSGLGSGSNYQPMQGGGFDSKISSPRSSCGDNPGKYVGYTLTGVFVVALIAVAVTFAFAFRRRKSRGDPYGTPYIPSLHNGFRLKSGPVRHYYVQHLGRQPSLYGRGKVSTKHVGAPFDSAQLKNGQIAFTYDMVMEITQAFSSHNIIGEGGFGCVYKGWMPDGKPVAVKRLRAGSGQGDREFRAEVVIISRVHHRHLVSLVGYCITEQQRVLIYEYVPNGTLHHHLHGKAMPVLDWAKRLKIAIGAAKGLAYLHEDCSQKIIHRDIKSANILLDNAFQAQVADFGLARLTDASHTHVSTRVMGTFGYMAPEYATSGKLTDRSDVFSFGVVLLELVTGRKPVDQTQPVGDESLVEWARPLLHRAIETHDFNALIDPRLEKHFVESEMFRMIEAAAACVRHSAPKRPRMLQVVRALDSGDQVYDLSNGVKYGHSTVYESGQYDRDIILFRRMANGSFSDSDFDMSSGESSFSRETSRECQHAWMHSSSSGELETRAFNTHRSSIE